MPRTVNTTEGAREVSAEQLVQDTPDLADQIADAKDDAELTIAVRHAFRKTLEKLQAEEKVPIRVPHDALNPWRKEIHVQINGVAVKVPVGKTVRVPASVAAALENSDYLG